MSYATKQNLIDRFGSAQLLLIADRDNDAAIDDDVVTQAITSASAVVDLAVRGLYALPLSPVDAVITDIVCDLARLRLYGNATQVPEAVTDAAKAAQSLLDDITAGRRRLSSAAASSDPSDEDTLAVLAEGDDPVFTMLGMQGF